MYIAEFLNVMQKIKLAYASASAPILEKFDIPQVSFDILMFLNNNPQYSTAQEISDVRHIKKNLVSVHVEKLVRAGYLKRSSVSGDRRKVRLSCTEKAKPIILEGIEMQNNFTEGLMFGISSEERKQYEGFLMTLKSNADEISNRNERKG